MAEDSFYINARIAGDRWRHDINNDHFGDLSTLNVLIEAPIGPWEMGTPLHYVIADLATRTLSLENGSHRVSRFYVNATIVSFGSTWEDGGTVTGLFSLDAVKFKGTTEYTFTIGSCFNHVFSIDAALRGYATFDVGAVIV